MAPGLIDPPSLSHHAQEVGAPCDVPLKALPVGWPTHLDAGMAWNGAEFDEDKTYTCTLSPTEISEIDDALEKFRDLGIDGSEASSETFVLPTLKDRLRASALDIHSGKGFLIIRGLDPTRYSPEDNTIIFLGISSYLGEKRGKQTDEGNIFAHVREAKSMNAAQEERPIKDSNLGSLFHSDLCCDILAMQVRSCAAKGGKHLIASAWKIYNELAATRPDMLEILTRPDWPIDLRRRFAQTDQRPLFYFHEGKVLLSIAPEALLGFDDLVRPAGLPNMSLEQRKAHNMLQSLARKHQVALTMQPGDLVFINNWSIVHAREAFEDDDQNSRYLVRMWLKNEELAWRLPPQLRRGNQAIFEDDDIEEYWNVLPTPRLNFHVYERSTP